MPTIYAVVYPDMFLEDLLMIPPRLHKVKHDEGVYSYSVEHNIKFFSTLGEAKDSFEISSSNGMTFFPRKSDEAILELELDANQITRFCKIYRATRVAKDERSKKWTITWKEDDIYDIFISKNALIEINKQYSNLKKSLEERFFGNNKDYQGPLKIIPSDSIFNASAKVDEQGIVVLDTGNKEQVEEDVSYYSI